MVFSSSIFLFGFLPVFLLAYFGVPDKWKNYVALVFSYFFYAWGEPKFAVVLLVSSLIDYYLSKGIKHDKKRLAVGLVLNLTLLAYFKYANFFVTELSGIMASLGLTAPHWTKVALPIGISFFTFQKVSYLMDVYRGEVKPAKKVSDYLLFVALFPQLIAGPIVRYHLIADELKKRSHSVDVFFDGLYRFVIGLGKKVLIADALASAADFVFALDGSLLMVEYAWIGVLCYAMQIYFDFSGYSDMAIGLGKMMGFKFPENFCFPYISRSISDFWRRWHMTLGGFMKEYLYIPLGGNRNGVKRTYFNLWAVFLLSGLWHGASWTFIVWGAYHGLFLVIDRLWWKNAEKKVPYFISVFSTFFVTLVGWIIFRSGSIGGAVSYTKRLFEFNLIGKIPDEIIWSDFMFNRTWTVLLVAIIISFWPLLPVIGKLSIKKESHLKAFKVVTILVLLFLSSISIINTSYHPFIYFNF